MSLHPAELNAVSTPNLDRIASGTNDERFHEVPPNSVAGPGISKVMN
jgi:hypothetical protein